MCLVVEMEVSDNYFMNNRDWDPVYLQDLFREDFFDFTEHWSSPLSDAELNQEMDKLEKYCPITEDISMEDEVLCQVVEKIEHE